VSFALSLEAQIVFVENLINLDSLQPKLVKNKLKYLGTTSYCNKLLQNIVISQNRK
jgi:hypothetical protein